MGFPGDSDDKESAFNIEDRGSFPELGRSPEEGMATYSSILALRIPVDRGAWRAPVHGVSKSQTQLGNSHTHTHTHTHVSDNQSSDQRNSLFIF